MLIKPWTEQPAPRHLLSELESGEEDPLTASPSLLPKVEYVHLHSARTEYLVVACSATRIITDALGQLPGVIESGRIVISPVKDDNDLEYIAEFDEDEQLYVNEEEFKDLKPVSVPVYTVTLETGVISFVSVPNLDNRVYHAIARVISAEIPFDTLLGIGTSELGRDTIEVLKEGSDDKQANSLIAQLQPLAPPHFITGPVASMAATVKALGKSVLVLVVNGEGAIHLNLEKCDLDLLVDCGLVVESYLHPGPEFMKSVKGSAIAKSSVSLGLYI
ncbi:unnamed protein product [Kuraishia capsulata CBS 1993]|uniref:Proteasome assembly chaperone 1 n=1 Tax=Kuraishia capsulata CBS 1993 TaxID=1382522 RepID=W6MSM9_9ASCO|nr:uncharacterized protein KUCA_T00005809001 [Kuraishia capsulata CBS 1993]CDK29816.1 unnamed protein product [Kuraishia capsulata CBS 1993]